MWHYREPRNIFGGGFEAYLKMYIPTKFNGTELFGQQNVFLRDLIMLFISQRFQRLFRLDDHWPLSGRDMYVISSLSDRFRRV
jgi:hypothetical protein